MFIITQQDRGTSFMSIRVTLTPTQNSFDNASARIWNVLKSKIEVNISLSKFKISLKLYLQEISLQLKYTN